MKSDTTQLPCSLAALSLDNKEIASPGVGPAISFHSGSVRSYFLRILKLRCVPSV